PLQFIINVVVTCGFEGAIISGNVGYWLYLPFGILTFALTDKVNLRGALRVILFFTAALALTILCLMQTVRQNARVTFSAGYSGGAVLITTRYGSVFVVSDDYYGNVYYGDADNLVVVGEDGYAAYFTLGGDFSNLYLSGGSINLNQIGNTTVTTADNFIVCGIEFTYESDCVIAEIEGVTVALKLVKKDNWGGNMPQRTQFCLYCCEDSDAQLFVGDEQYLLTYTGAQTYTFKDGNFTLANKIPKG
ncbi:MAG: hypothetical protein K2N47_02660, partial [Clostridia bacterium]|nr:hypothetical protein [Clostridia bacterium]